MAPLLLACILPACISFRAIEGPLIAEVEQHTKTQPAALRRTVLATFKVESHGNLDYELSIAPCHETKCDFEVRLFKGSSVVATLDLDWMKVRGPAVEGHADASSGVGDPLDTPKQIMAWSTGEEKDNFSIVARVVQLTPELNGLLIDQQAGYDLLKRHHDLVVAIGGKLVRAWTDEEGTGPTWSTVVVLGSGPNAPQQILAF